MKKILQLKVGFKLLTILRNVTIDNQRFIRNLISLTLPDRISDEEKQVQLQWTPSFKSGSCRLRFS